MGEGVSKGHKGQREGESGCKSDEVTLSCPEIGLHKK